MCRGRYRAENRVGEVQARGVVGGTIVYMLLLMLGNGGLCLYLVNISVYICDCELYPLRREVHSEIKYKANTCPKNVQFTLLKAQVLFYVAYWCVCQTRASVINSCNFG